MSSSVIGTRAYYFDPENTFLFTIEREVSRSGNRSTLTAFWEAHPDNPTPELPEDLRSIYVIAVPQAIALDANVDMAWTVAEFSWQTFCHNSR